MATEHVVNCSLTIPPALLARLDGEVARLRKDGQLVNRSMLIRHALIEVLPPEPEPESAPRKRRRA